jgi:two-component system, NtrC family, nitrogen regulation sensor histidine kinase NtrY
MAASGRIRRRLTFAVVVTAVIPVLVSIWIANSMVKRTAQRFYNPNVGARLDQSLDLYQELASAVKASMRHAATAIAADAELRAAAQKGDRAAVREQLKTNFPKYPNLVSLTVVRGENDELASFDRGKPLDPAKENKLEVTRPLSDAEIPTGEELPPADPPEGDDAKPPDAPRLIAVFAADKARFEERDEMSQFVAQYERVEQTRDYTERSYVYGFALLLGITMLAAFGVGSLFARGVSSRLGQLAEATKRVGAGDLSIRVPSEGNDEIGDLSRAFNRMVGEVENSRARIEYLQRIGAWQEMARRLAHEIKNPLTPIQLAVQEVHRRYDGNDPAFKKLIDTTREIVEDEVGTLRRLVSEFSSFARLPQATLERQDLAEFLREQRERISLVEDEMLDGEVTATVLPRGVELEFDLPDGPAEAYFDRQMLRRALLNLIRNAGQAVEGASKTDGKVRLSVTRDGDYWVIDVDDNGPGIPAEMRELVFDPYMTTKTEGTGLGLAIVKKIVVEHGGSVSAHASPDKGARIRLRLPRAGTGAASAALEARDWQAPPSSGRPSSTAKPSIR